MPTGNELAKAQARKLELENANLESKLEVMSKQSAAIDEDITNKRIQTSAAETKAYVAKKDVSMRWWSGIFSAIWSFLSSIGKVFLVLLRDLSPYIALAIVIIVFIIIFSTGSSSRPANPRYANRNAPRSSSYNIFGWLSPGYKVRSMMNYFNGNVKSIQRPIEKWGRCDNMEWQHMGGNGSGLCVRTYKPKDIEWSLSPDKIPDLKKLPKTVSDKITNNGERLKIYIPWAEQGPFYVPQCSKAYFKTLASDGTEKQVSATHLLKDNGLTCERMSFTAEKYGVSYRPVGSKKLDEYASDSNPQC